MIVRTSLRHGAAAALALLVAACGKGGPDDAAKAAPQALPVTTVQVATREVPVTFEAVGRTEGSREVQVRARVAGILEAQLYSEGDAVKAGAPLFRIERAPFEIDLAQQRAVLAQEQARNELAKQELERLKGLADRRAISQKEYDQSASALRQSDAALQLAQARVRQSELNLSYTSVEAPIDGVSGRAQQSIGSLLAPNSEASLLTTITRTDPLWVRFALSEAEYAGLRARGASKPAVKLETADGSAYDPAGRLNFAGSTVDATLGTVQLRAEFPNPKLQLLPGQYVKVRVVSGTQQAITVPQNAVLQNETGRFVWLVGPDGKAMQKNVKVGSWVGKDWIVQEGLKDGDSVIVDNLVRLRPGTAVQVK